MEQITNIEADFLTVDFKWKISGLNEMPWASECCMVSKEIKFEEEDAPQETTW
jgi:hypothetical protein